MKRLAIVFLSSLVFICCSCSKKRIVSEFNIVNQPPIKQVSIAEIGSPILEKARLFRYDGIILKSVVEITKPGYNRTYILFPGVLTAYEEDDEWTHYYAKPGNSVVKGPYDEVVSASGRLKIHKKNKEPDVVFIGGFEFNPEMIPEHTPTKVVDKDRPSFHQELIYNGCVENSVKFLYRELSKDYIRPAFSQTVQYDLSKSKIFGFKGARFKIIEAANTHIKYKILKSFSD